MSILIKDMEMPKSCKSCDLLQDYDGDMYCPLNDYLNFGDIENVPDYVMIGCPPSAQPEIIRCKDCKHWTNNIGDSKLRDNYCNDEAHGFYYQCSEDDYCSFAERRTDE